MIQLPSSAPSCAIPTNDWGSYRGYLWAVLLKQHSSSQAPGAYVQASARSVSYPTISGEVPGLRAIAHALYLGQNLLTISLSKV